MIKEREYCTVEINKNGYLAVRMPDGTYIPEQKDIKIQQDVDSPEYGTATITLIIKLKPATLNPKP